MPRKNTSKSKPASSKPNSAAPNKSEFIRAHSALKAAEVVSKGKAAGLDFAVEYVYAVRQNAKKLKTGGGGGASKATAHKASAASHGGPAESTFRKLVVELGISRARALVSDVESKLAALVRGL
jgi:hypothetical protein